MFNEKWTLGDKFRFEFKDFRGSEEMRYNIFAVEIFGIAVRID